MFGYVIYFPNRKRLWFFFISEHYEFVGLPNSEPIFFSALLFISKSWYFYWFQCQCSRWLCYLLGSGFDFFYLICNTMYLSDYQSVNHQWQFWVHWERALLFDPTKMELTMWQINFLSYILFKISCNYDLLSKSINFMIKFEKKYVFFLHTFKDVPWCAYLV